MLNESQLARIQSMIADAGVDGWLLFDFRGINPIATALLGVGGMVTRRWFCFVPREGDPVAITHGIEQGVWEKWPREWDKRVYSSWKALETELARVVGGRRVAMEYSSGDAVPYLDRIPAGVVEMVRNAGAEVVSSADLVTRFYAVWTADDLASHERAAEHIARIALNAHALAGERATAGDPMREFELASIIRDEFAAAGLETDHGPNVSVGVNAANPHYEPTAKNSSLIERGAILLIDLWAREPGGVFADQTWMSSLGQPSPRDSAVWEAVSGARIAATDFLRARLESGTPVRGGEADDVARAFIAERGFGDRFIHRTGHSIDSRDLHGSGPNLDNLESRDDRLLLPGVGFSIEPGVYIAGEVGMRSEVNAFVTERGLIVTPADPQIELLIV